jgi:purine-binding chemotaxis protein CheW
MAAAHEARLEVERAQYFTFFLAQQEYAVPVLGVSEVIEYQPLTRVPTTPPHVLGVLDLRGRVVSVIDLLVKLELGESRVTPRSCVVLVDVEEGDRSSVIGILVDAVGEVVELDTSEIAAVDAPHLVGTFPARGRLVNVLDLDVALGAVVEGGAQSSEESARDGGHSGQRPASG